MVLLANGERKVEPVAASLLGDVTPDIPISYSQLYAKQSGTLIYVTDKIAAHKLLAETSALLNKSLQG